MKTFAIFITVIISSLGAPLSLASTTSRSIEKPALLSDLLTSEVSAMDFYELTSAIEESKQDIAALKRVALELENQKQILISNKKLGSTIKFTSMSCMIAAGVTAINFVFNVSGKPRTITSTLVKINLATGLALMKLILDKNFEMLQVDQENLEVAIELNETNIKLLKVRIEKAIALIEQKKALIEFALKIFKDEDPQEE